MSYNPTVDINRYRMNSRSSIDNYSYGYQNSHQNYEQSNQHTPQQSIKQIPLILKNMNPVQKYVHEFKITQMLQKQQRPVRSQSPLYDPSLSTSQHLKKILSKSPTSQKIKQSQLKDLQEKCYIKYSSISSHDTGLKYQALENCQTQYVKLKNSIHHNTMVMGSNERDGSINGSRSVTMHYSNQRTLQSQTQHSSTNTLPYSPTSTPPISQPHSFVNPKSIYLLNKKKSREQNGQQLNKIHSHDIEKQLKTSVIEQNGKKYFADLFMMKKQRDKMLKEIFGANKEKNKSNKNELNNQSNHIQQGPSLLDRNSSYRSQKTSFSLQKTSKSFTTNNNNININQIQKKFPKLKVNLTQLPIKKSQQKSQSLQSQSQDENFIQQKILKDRSQKKQKMLKGRNMNWNVYYEMLALKKNQKDKLKGYCKFSQTYGED